MGSALRSLLGLSGLTSNTHLYRVSVLKAHRTRLSPDSLTGSGGAGHEVEQTEVQGGQRCRRRLSSLWGQAGEVRGVALGKA